MFNLFDEDLDAMELVEGALALNCAVNPDINNHWVELELKRLLKEAELSLIAQSDEQQRFEELLRLFYFEWGFSGDSEEYFSSDNVFIDKVLERRKGIPVSLGALLLFLPANWDFRLKR